MPRICCSKIPVRTWLLSNSVGYVVTCDKIICGYTFFRFCHSHWTVFQFSREEQATRYILCHGFTEINRSSRVQAWLGANSVCCLSHILKTFVMQNMFACLFSFFRELLAGHFATFDSMVEAGKTNIRCCEEAETSNAFNIVMQLGWFLRLPVCSGSWCLDTTLTGAVVCSNQPISISADLL